ncbi:putative ankyrin repeat protein [Paramyrothecium foliicola]|nr:putative ankyrin repeat protein [Paramyrothecium foliicola]
MSLAIDDLDKTEDTEAECMMIERADIASGHHWISIEFSKQATSRINGTGQWALATDIMNNGSKDDRMESFGFERSRSASNFAYAIVQSISSTVTPMASLSSISPVKPGHGEIIELLLDKGADANARDETILHLLRLAPHTLHEEDEDGRTVIHTALAHRAGEENGRLLISSGVDCGALTSAGDTALHLLFEQCWQLDESGGLVGEVKELCDLLLSKGALVNVKTNQCETSIFNFFRKDWIKAHVPALLDDSGPRLASLPDESEDAEHQELHAVALVEVETFIWPT